MTDPEKLRQLYDFLDKAIVLSSEFSGGHSNNFLSAEEFNSALSDSVDRLKNGDNDQISNLYYWFAPTCDWDDLIHKNGLELSNVIFGLLTDLKKSLPVYDIIDLVRDYQNSVDKVMVAFKKKFNRTDLLTACRHDKLYSQNGEIKEFGIKHYAFHGIGLHATFKDNSTVDFDFAFFPEQRQDGFDLWRLQSFVADQPNKYKKYLDKTKLEADFNNLIDKGSIRQPDISPSTTLYFFTSSLTRTNEPQKAWWKFWT
jgi:hypothetical protein